MTSLYNQPVGKHIGLIVTVAFWLMIHFILRSLTERLNWADLFRDYVDLTNVLRQPPLYSLAIQTTCA